MLFRSEEIRLSDSIFPLVRTSSLSDCGTIATRARQQLPIASPSRRRPPTVDWLIDEIHRTPPDAIECNRAYREYIRRIPTRIYLGTAESRRDSRKASVGSITDRRHFILNRARVDVPLSQMDQC